MIQHDGGERADVDPSDYVVVEVGEGEVEDQGAPDSYMVPDSPVLGVQSNLSILQIVIRFHIVLYLLYKLQQQSVF